MNNIVSIISAMLIGGVLASADVTFRDWQLYVVLAINSFMSVFNSESNKPYIGNPIAIVIMLIILNTAGIYHNNWQYWVILVIVLIESLVSYVKNHS